MKNFVTVDDVAVPGLSLSPSIDLMIEKALAYKQEPWKDLSLGRRRRVGIVFLNPSLRTRMSTQIAAEQLGMRSIVFNIGSEGWSWELEDGSVMNGTSVEHIKDAVPVLSTYFDVLAIRTFPGLKDRAADYAETVLNSFIKYATVPVISLESATLHPLQSFADLITIKELQITKPKVVLCWAPHIKPLPQCVANSFVQWTSAWDHAELVITHPEGYELAPEIVQNTSVIYDRRDALEQADIIYVKNWSAYNDYGTMPPVSKDWMLEEADMAITNNARVMHCLPVRRNIELSDAILDGKHSMVIQQAGNRVWSAQAVLAEILKSNYGAD